MPSPVGHTLAGLCGLIIGDLFLSKPPPRPILLISSAIIANLPDLDMLPGVLLLGDPKAFHRQATHSLFMAIVVGVIAALLVKRHRNRLWWGVWATGLYAGHICLDFLVEDSGVQAFWPLSKDFFHSYFALFAGFNYSQPGQSTVATLFSLHNFLTVTREIIIILPLIWLTLYLIPKTSFNKFRS